MDQDDEKTEFIVEQSRRMGRPIPERIANAPELWPGLELCWIAFSRLDSGRTTGFGASKISWMQIEEYCDRIKLFGPERDIMHHHIRVMDAAFLKASKAKQTKLATPNDKTIHKR